MQNQIQKNGLYTPAFSLDWDKVVLYDLANWVNGRAFKNSDFSKSGFPILKIAEIKNGLSEQTNYTTKKYGDNIFIRPGDILFSWSGTPETSIDVFSWDGFEGWLNQHTFRVKPKEVVDKKFFFYLLKYIKKNFVKIASNKKTTGLGHVTVDDLKNLVVAIPSEPYQEKIAFVLSAFDDKIEANNKIAKTLEEMAQAIFKEWFIKFKFPGHGKAEFIDSELGKIPKRWHLGTFSEIANISIKSISPNNFKDEEFLHHSIPAYDTQGFPIREKGVNVLSNKFLIPKECVLICKLNPRIPRIWLPEFDVNLKSIASTEFIVLIPNENTTKEFTYSFCTSKYFQDIFQGRTTGTSTSHQRVRPNDLLNIQFAVPPDNIIIEYSTLAKPIYSYIQKLKRENQKLAVLRDLLLPKLMRGEIKV